MLNKIFGKRQEKALNAVDSRRGGWFRILEPFAGAWQRNQEERVDSLLQYPTLYACISRVSTDIGKIPFRLKARGSNGIWNVIERKPHSPLLDRPNHYQTPQQFREAWVLSKLLQGNAYVLKARSSGGAVTGLYVLDPMRVMPLISDSGEVFYQLYTDNLNLLAETNGQLVVPADDIIHDRCVCPFHPLIGLPPISAAHWPALKNMRILRSSAEFFGNGAQPSGILSAPGAIGDETATRLSSYWNENFTGRNAGKVAVVGDGLSFVSLAAKSVDSQMVEQLRYSDEQICQPFGIPPFKVGLGTIPSGLGVDAINQLYYEDALQAHIQSMECLLTAGIGVQPLKVDLDESILMRMDSGKKAEYHRTLMDAGIETNNEARREFGLPPLDGGDTVYMQQQDFPLDQVRHNRIPDGGAPGEPEPDDTDDDAAEADAEEVRRLSSENWQLKLLAATREAVNG